MNVIYVRSDLLTESFIELRIAVEFLSERNYGYEILTHSLTHSLTFDYLGQYSFVKYFLSKISNSLPFMLLRKAVA